jgi:Cytochrome P460
MGPGRLAVAGAAALALAGCGGSEQAHPTSATAPPPTTTAVTTNAEPPVVTTTEVKTKPIAGIPRFVWPYAGWSKLNRKPVPARDSDPHLGTKDVYASQAARGGTYPHGTIIVKQATRPGKHFIGLLAVMRKERCADPAHNDWVFVEYTRGSAGEPFTETASGAVCWSCHMGAAADDYVWIAKLGLTR